MASASAASSTNIALPVSLPFAADTPLVSRRPICSETPIPNATSPAAMRGSSASFCSSLPAAAKATGAMIEEAT